MDLRLGRDQSLLLGRMPFIILHLSARNCRRFQIWQWRHFCSTCGRPTGPHLVWRRHTAREGRYSVKTARHLTFWLAMACVLAGPRPATATSITITGDDVFVMNWLYEGTDPDLAATATFTITNWSATSFDLAVSDIENTTALSPDIDARFVSFGFGLTPDATGTSNLVNGSDFSWGFSNFPAFQQVDICAFAGNNCAGGSNAGLDQGESSTDVLSITFTGNFAQGVTFSPIPARFQTALGSYTFDDGDVCIDCEPFEPLVTPEPATLLLFGTGLLATRFGLRRRTRSSRTR